MNAPVPQKEHLTCMASRGLTAAGLGSEEGLEARSPSQSLGLNPNIPRVRASLALQEGEKKSENKIRILSLTI